jgi:hypothetical protein
VIEATAAADVARFFLPEIASKITHSRQQIRPGQARRGKRRSLMWIFVASRVWRTTWIRRT